MMQLEHKLGTRCKNVVKHGILHVTIEDLTFPKISWLLKGYNEDHVIEIKSILIRSCAVNA